MDTNKVVTKQVTSGTKLESIGTVKTVIGIVKAVDQSGAERILVAGDKVFANEVMVNPKVVSEWLYPGTGAGRSTHFHMLKAAP
jgi:hypothetical protein